MLNEDDVDLEEIESHLYSLVYHASSATATDEHPIFANQSQEESVELAKPPNRYFHNYLHKGSKYRKNNVASQFKTPNAYASPSSHAQKSPNSKKYESGTRGDNIAINQLVVVNPYKNIVCMSADKNANKKGKRNNNKKRNKTWKDNERKLKNLIHILTPSKPKKKTQNNIDTKLHAASKRCDDVVITLSDSDNEDCVEVEKDWPCLIVTDSDEDKTLVNETVSSGHDEVLFVEPAPVPVISIEDDDTICNQYDPGEKCLGYEPKERSELLSTPESASNDFIENNSSVEGVPKNFNFSLHGVDFHGGAFVKSVPLSHDKSSERCETESSSSTTDLGTLKGSVFNEVEFPKDNIFSEANLETFGDFITPMRRSPCREVTSISSSTPNKEAKTCRNVCTDFSSDNSSSESDYDETTSFNGNQRDKVKRLSKLPNLSPMHSDNEQHKAKNKAKKRKSDQVLVDKSKSKKHKHKKKKNCPESGSESAPSPHPREPDDEIDKTDHAGAKKAVTSKLDEIPAIAAIEIKEEPKCVENIDVLQGYQVVDETFYKSVDNLTVITSDSDSNLSPLDDKDIDIKLGNCDDPKTTTTGEKSSRAHRKKRSIDLTVATVEEVQCSMRDDPNLWTIIDRDRSYITAPVRGRRCNRCRQFGHLAVKCPNRDEPIKCPLCGCPGHLETRCPNRICTQCGSKGNFSTNYCGHCFKFRRCQCRLCGVFGHMKDKCPDLWRRYHLTTEPGPVVTHSGPILKPRHKLWCSGCARSGHLEYNCKYYTSEYPPSVAEICDYQDVYITDKNDEIDQDFAAGGSSHLPNSLPHTSFGGNPLGHPEYYVGNPLPSLFDGRNADIAPVDVTGFYFEDCLPNFLSFELHQPVVPPRFEPPPQFVEESSCPPPPSPLANDEEKLIRSHNKYHVFSEHAVITIQQFVSSEIRKLMKLSSRIQYVSKTVKRSFFSNSSLQIGSHFKTLNMVLFGIFKFHEGKHHIDKLKNFRVVSPKSRFSRSKRQDLYESYCYIFGSRKHQNVDYHDLLMRI